MTHFETYHVHLYKQVTARWTDEQHDESMSLIEDGELCALLEAVTVLYLKQRGPLSADLIVGARLQNDYEMNGYCRPFMTDTLDSLPMLRQMLVELDAKATRTGGVPDGPQQSRGPRLVQ